MSLIIMLKYLEFIAKNDDIDFARIERFQEYMHHRTPTVCCQRAKIFTRVFQDNPNLSFSQKKALAFKATLNEMTIYLEKDSLIVGNQASRNFAAPIFPEYSFEWVINELDEFENRSGDYFKIDEVTKSELRKIRHFWQGQTHQDQVFKNINPTIKDAEKQGVLHLGGISMSGDGHIIPDHQMLLEIGFIGVIKIASEKLQEKHLAIDKIEFYQNIIIAMEAANNYIARFCVILIQESQIESNRKRKQEFLDMNDALQEILNGEIVSFLAAVQLLYFTHLFMMIESNGHSFSYGRFDQLLNGIYQKNVNDGLLTKEKALEIITHFFLMNNSLNKIRPWGHTQFSGGYPLYSNLMIGGCLASGNDATNDLTYLSIEAMNLSRLPEPNFSLRIHQETPQSLLLLSAKLIREGFGQPSIFTDEVCIPAMTSIGIPSEDAKNYAAIGCVEIGIPGKTGHRPTGMTYINFGKILELVINNGLDPKTKIQLISINQQPNRDIEFNSYQEVWNGWKKLLKYYLDLAHRCDLICDRSLKKYDSDPFASGSMRCCLDIGKLLKDGGCLYDHISSSNIGPSVVGDSLAVIKKLIFDEQQFNFSKLREILDSNFEGIEGAKYRLMMRKVAKFGNDDDYVDDIVCAVYRSFLDLLPPLKTDRYGLGPIVSCYTMSTSNITSYVPNGFDVGATPDGRLAGKPLNEGASPCLGADKDGPTAVINSISKLPNKEIAGGQLLNMRFAPSALADLDNLSKFVDFMRVLTKKNIFHNQFNVIDSQTLKKARANPNDYPNLMVRVAGYCALFTTLMPEAQDAIIERSELTWN